MRRPAFAITGCLLLPAALVVAKDVTSEDAVAIRQKMVSSNAAFVPKSLKAKYTITERQMYPQEQAEKNTADLKTAIDQAKVGGQEVRRRWLETTLAQVTTTGHSEDIDAYDMALGSGRLLSTDYASTRSNGSKQLRSVATYRCDGKKWLTYRTSLRSAELEDPANPSFEAISVMDTMKYVSDWARRANYCVATGVSGPKVVGHGTFKGAETLLLKETATLNQKLTYGAVIVHEVVPSMGYVAVNTELFLPNHESVLLQTIRSDQFIELMPGVWRPTRTVVTHYVTNPDTAKRSVKSEVQHVLADVNTDRDIPATDFSAVVPQGAVKITEAGHATFPTPANSQSEGHRSDGVGEIGDKLGISEEQLSSNAKVAATGNAALSLKNTAYVTLLVVGVGLSVMWGVRHSRRARP